MCKYCNITKDNGAILCGNFDDGNVVNLVKLDEGFFIDMWMNFERLFVKKINYCHICGRKLENEK